MARFPAGVRMKWVCSVSRVCSKWCSQVSQPGRCVFGSRQTVNTYIHEDNANVVAECPCLALVLVSIINKSVRYSLSTTDGHSTRRRKLKRRSAFIIHTNFVYHPRQERSLIDSWHSSWPICIRANGFTMMWEFIETMKINASRFI